MKPNHDWDQLLRDALQEEEAPPVELQQHLVRQIRQRSGWSLPWWLPAVAGMIQTVSIVIGIQLIVPNSWFASLLVVGGAVTIVGGAVLSWQIKRRTIQKEREWQWG